MIPIQRRSVLKGAGVLGSILLAPKLPLWSLAEAAPTRRAPASFVGLSSALLGIRSEVIDRPLQQDNIAMSDVYYNLCNIAGEAAMSALLTEYERLAAFQPPSVIALLLLTTGAGVPRLDALGTFSRLSLLAWLYGVWYGGTEVSRNPEAAAFITDSSYQVDFLVSGRAYKDGWIWRIAQSHPMGFSQFNFGSWASAAPALADYGIGA